MKEKVEFPHSVSTDYRLNISVMAFKKQNKADQCQTLVRSRSGHTLHGKSLLIHLNGATELSQQGFQHRGIWQKNAGRVVRLKKKVNLAQVFATVLPNTFGYPGGLFTTCLTV